MQMHVRTIDCYLIVCFEIFPCTEQSLRSDTAGGFVINISKFYEFHRVCAVCNQITSNIGTQMEKDLILRSSCETKHQTLRHSI